MEARIFASGTLQIKAETELEAYALTKWYSEYGKKIHSSGLTFCWPCPFADDVRVQEEHSRHTKLVFGKNNGYSEDK
jgi:hypothetical protein